MPAWVVVVGSIVWWWVVVPGLLVAIGIALARRHRERETRRRKAARDAGSPSDAASLRTRMKRRAQPTLLLAPAKEAGFSKLGGEPELPSGMDWPMGLEGPRAFLAQLDLGEVRKADGPDWLPPEGWLYTFYDDQVGGFADQVSILFSTTPPGPPVTPPAALAKTSRFRERRVGFLGFTSIPSLDWLGVDVRHLDVSEDELDDLSDMPDEPFGDELQHRIGGYPSEIQETQMALECEHLARGLPYPAADEIPPSIDRASKTWRLLLQVDSDPALKMNFGDAGRLYVFVREKDARAGDFSKTITLSQTS